MAHILRKSSLSPDLWDKKTYKILQFQSGVSDSCLYFSYSGNRDQEAFGWKPTRAKSLQTPIWKKAIMRKGLGKCVR
jgi:hypothetical protein